MSQIGNSFGYNQHVIPIGKLNGTAMASTPVPGQGAIGSCDDQATLPPSAGINLPVDADATLPPSGPAPTGGLASFPHIPGYEILNVLGQGGMGVVYRARHQKLHRLVALKMIRGSFVEHQDQRQRFILEAEAVARLQHSNIVQIFEIGDVVLADGSSVPFMALEFVEGQSLEQYLLGRPMSPTSTAELVADLARAAQFAHERNIIHRDLKPANILLGKWDSASKSHHPGEPTGTRRVGTNISFCPKITDFGLAKQIDADSSQTKAGEIMGTPSYMAPEQAEAQPNIGPPADIYALGAILYELLTGRPPFRAATALDTIMQVVAEEPVPPSRLQPSIPKDVETVCLKCLAKAPAKRYTTAGELADDLDRFLRNEPIHARPITVWEKSWKWAKRRPSAAALIGVSILALVALLSGGLWFNHVVRLERDTALKAESNAKAAKSLADAKGQEAQANLDQLSIANGVRLADGGDLFGGLVWFTRPLHKEVVYRTHERLNRDRITFYLNYTPRPTLRHTFWHNQGVRHGAFSPDGAMVVTSSADQTAQVWDAETGEAIGPPLRHKGRVVKSLFSPDSRLVLTLSVDKTAQLWDARTGQLHGPPMIHPHEVVDGEFSRDGKLVLTTAADDKNVYLWTSATSQQAGDPISHDDEVNFATFVSDKTIVVATGSKEGKAGTVHFWNAADRTPLRPPYRVNAAALHVTVTRDSKRAAVSCANAQVRIWSPDQPEITPLDMSVIDCRRAYFTPDGRRLATYSENKKVLVWDANTGRQVGQSIENRDIIRSLEISPDGRKLLTAGDDKMCRVWNLETGSPITPPLPHRNYVDFAAFSPDGRRLITASADQTSRLWDLATDQPTPVAGLRGWPLIGIALSPDGRRVVTASFKSAMAICDVQSGSMLHPPIAHPDVVKDACFSLDGRFIASACKDGIARLWDASTYQLIRELKGHAGGITSVRFNPRGDAIFTTGMDGSARIWETHSGRCSHVLKHNGPVMHGDLNHDGTLFFTGGVDRVVRLSNATTGELACPPMPGHTGNIVYGAFSPDGSTLATTSWDYSTRLWNTATGQPHCPPMMHDGAMMKVAFSRDGKRLVTTSEDNTARLWDTQTGRAVTPPLMHVGWALDAQFDANGDRLLTANRFYAARFWNALTGQPISPPIIQTAGRTVQVNFVDSETRFISASMNDGIRIWPIPNDNRPTEDLIRLAETYQGSRLDAFGGLSAIPQDEHRVLWQGMKRDYPQDFSVSTRSRLAWHRQEMVKAFQERNADSVAFHFLRAFPQWTLLFHLPVGSH